MPFRGQKVTTKKGLVWGGRKTDTRDGGGRNPHFRVPPYPFSRTAVQTSGNRHLPFRASLEVWGNLEKVRFREPRKVEVSGVPRDVTFRGSQEPRKVRFRRVSGNAVSDTLRNRFRKPSQTLPNHPPRPVPEPVPEARFGHARNRPKPCPNHAFPGPVQTMPKPCPNRELPVSLCLPVFREKG